MMTISGTIHWQRRHGVIIVLDDNPHVWLRSWLPLGLATFYWHEEPGDDDEDGGGSLG